MSATPVNSRTSNFVARGRHEWTVEDFARREEGNGVSLQTRQVFEYPLNVGLGVSICLDMVSIETLDLDSFKS
jgi:hypothetical protein